MRPTAKQVVDLPTYNTGIDSNADGPLDVHGHAHRGDPRAGAMDLGPQRGAEKAMPMAITSVATHALA